MYIVHHFEMIYSVHQKKKEDSEISKMDNI